MSRSISRRSFVSGAAGLAGLAALGLVGCGSSTSGGSATTAAASTEAAPSTVTIKSFNANKELVDLEVPFDPKRLAMLDMASLDIVNDLGLGERVVGSATTSIDYLQDYVGKDSIANLGTIKEADLEAVAGCEPDLIFIGGRLSKSYDDLSQIAPVVYLSTDAEKGLVQSVRDNATTIASIFGKEDEVASKMDGFDGRLAKIAEAASGQTALVTLFTSGSVNVLGNDGRCSIIGKEAGFANLAADQVSSTHGNEISFETIVAENPDLIFVMNRDAAIGSDGASQAQEVVENELTKNTKAYADGHIVYLEHPAVWYTAEGGIEALDVMIADLEGPVLG